MLISMDASHKGLVKYLIFSGLIHIIFIGFLTAATRTPFGGPGDGIIVVNLTSLTFSQAKGQGRGKAAPPSIPSPTPSPTRGEGNTRGEAYADMPQTPSPSSSGGKEGSGGTGAADPRLFGAGGPDRVPAIIDYVDVEYPPEARRTIVEGDVVVKILISRDGRVEMAEVVRSSAKILEDAVLKAVKQWRFEPPTIRGRVTSLWMVIPFKFTLK